MSDQTVLEALNVGYQVGERALLTDVSLSLRPGEVLALVGPNGAGKSTLLKLLARDLLPNHGQVLLDGKDLNTYSAKELALRRAVLPQQTILQFAFRAHEVVMMGRHPHLDFYGYETHKDRSVVKSVMQQTEVISLAERHFPTLSGGEQARVSLARVLAQETPLLLLDEPTAALDIRHQEMMMTTIQQLARAGATVLMVIHELNMAACYADRLALLSQGQLVAMGTPQEVLTEQLLSEVFAYPIMVTSHPLHGCPLVVPIPFAVENGQRLVSTKNEHTTTTITNAG